MRACARVLGGEVGFEGEAVSLRAFMRAFVHVGLHACVLTCVCFSMYVCVCMCVCFSMCVCFFHVCVFPCVFSICVFHMFFGVCVCVGGLARGARARALGCA